MMNPSCLPFLKKENIEITNTILIGDQLLTDIKCANKLGLDSVLVKSISRKSEKWYTRINRLREKRVINQDKCIKCGTCLTNCPFKAIGN